MICLHGLTKDFCSFCNGTYSTKKSKRILPEVSSELINKYDKLKEKFKNYREIWSEDEFFVVYANMKDVLGTKLELSAKYQTGIELNRTLGAINWAISHIFSEKQYHRGRTVIEFRKIFGLEKELA